MLVRLDGGVEHLSPRSSSERRSLRDGRELAHPVDGNAEVPANPVRRDVAATDAGPNARVGEPEEGRDLARRQGQSSGELIHDFSVLSHRD